ncbi:MAG: beta-glucosidase family protein [Sphingorhabdus sp.]
MMKEKAAMSDYAPRKGMTETEIDRVVDSIIAEATLAEKVGMLSGKGFFKAFMEDGRVWAARPYRAGGGIERLWVPALWFTDGPRGVARGNSTCFPCSMARGASFDPDLERRIGEVMGIEARAQGCNLSGAVCFNLLRHPAWGRAQETYGEDPHHLGEMGTALATGIQTHNVIATVKHFALNSMENARFKVDVQIDERALHEVYLPHFKRAIDAGCASVMSAYNKMNGTYCGQNPELLTGILRDEWGFDGFVHSDWVKGVYDVSGVEAGLDIENPEPLVWGDKLIAAVETGKVPVEIIDRACCRIVRTLYRFAAAEDPLPNYPATLVARPEHIAIALEAAEKSAVLLKNDAALPLRRGLGTLAVLGCLASIENTGDNGSSRVRPPYVITPLLGLERAQKAYGVERIITADESDLAAAAITAAAADAIVVIAGYTAREEGEYIPGDLNLGQGSSDEAREAASRVAIGGDRDDLGLPADQIALIETAIASGKPVVVVLVAGSAVMVEGWGSQVGAILQTFYSGIEGGTALARLLFGAVSPSGKLPFTVARDSTHYPFFDKDADAIRYDLWHGYSKLDRDGHAPRYAFGHGLSYAAFAYRDLTAEVALDTIHVALTVENQGSVAADEVVQVYVGPPAVVVERQKKLLKAFARVLLAPGEAKRVDFTIALDDLRWRDGGEWRLEAGIYHVCAGGASDQLIETTVNIG